VAADGYGNIYIADGQNNRVRKVNASGVISTIAGGGTSGLGDGGPATAAELNCLWGISVDNYTGNIYVTQSYLCGTLGNRIRKINSSGIITTFAGTGSSGSSGDGGPATAATLDAPYSAVAEASGNVYITEGFGNRIRKVDTSGIITTIAGTGYGGYSGDGGPAIYAELFFPIGIATDGPGNIYFSDQANQRIRKIDPSGIITTIAGNGTSGYSGDGCAATAAELYNPMGLAIDISGNIYFTVTNRVRKLGPNHAPYFTNGHSHSLTVCEYITDSLNSLLGVVDSDLDGSDTWGIATTPMHGIAVTSYTAISLGDTMIPVGLSYTPMPGYTGNDSFKVRVTDCMGAADTTTIHVTISGPAPIAGTMNVCAGLTNMLSDAVSGGTWSSANTAGATIGSLTGAVTGIATGTTTISYTLISTACSITATVTVNPLPGTITGTTSVCVGATTTLTNSTSGGMWSSSSTSIATVGSSTGVMISAVAGTSSITYILPTGCMTNTIVTVNSLPLAITGTTLICGGATTALSETFTGGSWRSGNLSVASVGTASGIVAGGSVTAAGTATITYTTPAGCTTFIVVTVDPSPTPISGGNILCAGASISLSDGGGGSWGSSNTSIATAGTSGIVSGISGGVANISYTLPDGCSAEYPVTVNAAPSAIMGATDLCVGTTSMLTDTTAVGSWSSSNTAAAIDPMSGIVTAGLFRYLNYFLYFFHHRLYSHNHSNGEHRAAADKRGI